MMEAPFVLCDDGDIMRFKNVENLATYVEPIDVENAVYKAFDASGEELELFLKESKSNISRVSVIPSGKRAPDNLKAELSKFIKATDSSFDNTGLSLNSILNEFLTRFGYTV